MPELKHTFMSGRMNKDLDERLVPNGEYRDAWNVEVLTSEGSNMGTVQTCLGNSVVSNIVPDDRSTCVGGIVDDKGRNVISYGEIVKTSTLKILSDRFKIKKPITLLRVSKKKK